MRAAFFSGQLAQLAHGIVSPPTLASLPRVSDEARASSAWLRHLQRLTDKPEKLLAPHVETVVRDGRVRSEKLVIPGEKKP